MVRSRLMTRLTLPMSSGFGESFFADFQLPAALGVETGHCST
jgi:hypothetical protein